MSKDKKTYIMCAYDKSRKCDATCVAFYVVVSSQGNKYECKRLDKER